MKIIKIPPNIMFKSGEISKEVSFKEYAFNNPLNDPKWGNDYNSLFTLKKIREGLEKVEENEWLLNENEWKMLAAMIQEPTHKYNVELSLQFVDYMRAVMEAENFIFSVGREY